VTAKTLSLAASTGRRVLWRSALTLTGGVRSTGELPPKPCVIVANHSSHADTAALLAALPPSRRPVAAAAADYWFKRPGRGRLLRRPSWRALFCRALCAAFPVRRGGGGSADLAAAAELLAGGHDVIIFAEGTRSRDGGLGRFRTGAARLAASAGAPLVPARIEGTRELLPVHGKLHRCPVTVRFGDPVETSGPRNAEERTERIRAAIVELGDDPRGSTAVPDSRVRRRVAAVAASRLGILIVAAWAFAEALSFPILPEVALAIACVAAPRAGVRLTLIAAASSVLGGVAGYELAAHAIALPQPLTTGRMHAVVAAQTAREGAAAVRHQPFSGIPFKVYAAQAGRAHVGLGAFVRQAAAARGARIAGFGLGLTAFGAAARSRRRFYGWYLAAFGVCFVALLAAVLTYWAWYARV
jgi:1-acyl-sn-glycerol-3-phosphate acyltransferase/membrane protein YqaA with SNARE-associated domain